MEKFVHQENLRRYQELLLKVTDENQRKQIQHMIAQEKAKDSPPLLGRTAE